MIDRCSIENCNNVAQRIIKVFDAGYCLRHWHDISGNLDHLPVTRLYPCQFCGWMFSSHALLNQHVKTVHIKGEEGEINDESKKGFI